VNVLVYLIPIALGLGLIGLAAFLWALKSGQFDDLDGAAHRILFDDDDAAPPPPAPQSHGAPAETREKPRE
jgi:cbb3-type cytochrome oxidase maturation protein